MSVLRMERGALEGRLAADFAAVTALAYPAASLRHRQEEKLNEPLLVSAVVVYRDQTPVARCCLYDNPGLQHEGEQALLIGNFEALEDGEAGALLLAEAEASARQRGKPWIIGPMNGSTWDAYRFVTGEQAAPFLSEPVQQAYYASLFEACGMEIIHRYSTWAAPIAAKPQHEAAGEASLRGTGVQLRALSPDRFAQDLQAIYPLCHAAFRHNPLYTPISADEFAHRYLPLKPLLEAGYSYVAEDGEGKIPAFLLAFPDACNPDRLVIKTMAKHPDCAIKGLVSIMADAPLQAARNNGLREVLHAFIHEDNVRSLARSQDFGGRLFREYVLYAKKVPA